MGEKIREHFERLEDPRQRRGRRHLLADMMVIALLAVICGAEDWSSVATFGRAKRKWFKSFLRLPYGIASHFTFERVFAALRPEAFERCFADWMAQLARCSGGQLIAIDGKTLRRSFDRASETAAIHMVSAWASANQVVLGQLATEAKSNEITAIPRLLELLDLEGATVTIDAEGCQTNIARKVVDQGGDYVLALKANQPTMHEEVKLFLDEAIARHGKDRNDTVLDFNQSTEGDHGRIETRRCWVTGEVDWFDDRPQWAGLNSLAAVECERTVGEETTCERRYFISSLAGTDAQVIARAVRNHWEIENKLHWVLDVGFGEDACRIRKGHGAENFSRLRRMALNLLRQEKTQRLGIKNKRLLAGWDHDYLLKLLTG